MRTSYSPAANLENARSATSTARFGSNFIYGAPRPPLAGSRDDLQPLAHEEEKKLCLNLEGRQKQRSVPATCAARTAGRKYSTRSWRVTGARYRASISAPTRASLTLKSMISWKPSGSSKRFGFRPTGFCRIGSATCSSAQSGDRRIRCVGSLPTSPIRRGRPSTPRWEGTARRTTSRRPRFICVRRKLVRDWDRATGGRRLRAGSGDFQCSGR
jgi:hypothetical protein